MRASFGSSKRIGLQSLFRHHTLSLGAALIAWHPSAAAAAEPLSRQEAVAEALARNPAIAAAREQVAQARARVSEAKALPDPTFESTLEQQQTLLTPRTAKSKDFGLGLPLP